MLKEYSLNKEIPSPSSRAEWVEIYVRVDLRDAGIVSVLAGGVG